MKIKKQLILTLGIAASLAFNVPIRADGEHEHGDDHERGGQVEGREDLHQKLRLTATADAPDGATGCAKIKAHDDEGVSSASLKIKVKGLIDGTYTVIATNLSDGASNILGTFDVITSSGDEDDDDGDGEEDGDDDEEGSTLVGEGAASAGDFETDEDEGGEIEFGDDGEAFPDGFNPLDIGGIQIADANGVVLLAGDFTDLAQLAHSRFFAKVRITPGPAATAASGRARVHGRVVRKAVHQAFAMTVKNVPKSAELTLKVNGRHPMKVRSTRSGQLRVTKLPGGVLAHRVVTVTVEDKDGVQILGAHF